MDTYNDLTYTSDTTSGTTYVTLPPGYIETVTVNNNNDEWIVKYNKPRKSKHSDLDELFEREL
jgi:hypothetical protein